ncbi:hypothetical protein Sjap_003620 [Stephania japonica]|uniref:Pentatricopeptide repeat-containing protein n=1 Tax=Stephania japonica TaxID=461633 RepID=A0AAP0KQ29_9MAGN
MAQFIPSSPSPPTLLLSNTTSTKTHKTPSLPIQTHKHPFHNPNKNNSKKMKKKKNEYKHLSQSDPFPLHSRNPSSIHKHIQTLARQDHLPQALSILHSLSNIPINPTTFSALIAAAIRAKSLPHARLLHAHIALNSLHRNEFLLAKLLHMYSACGAVHEAQELVDRGGFSAATTMSVYLWNSLLRGKVVNGNWRCGDVVETFSKMRELGVELNVYSFSCFIKSLAGAAAVGEGLKVHGLLIKNGFQSGSIIIQTSLIDFYFKCGKVKLARQVFDEMPERDVVVWGAVIAGFAHNGLYWEVLECLKKMRFEGVGVNSVIVTSVLPVIGELKVRNLGREVHGYVIKTKNYANHMFVRSGLIDMYCKCGDMDYGRRVFYSSVDRSVVSWTALMSGYVSNGRLDQALRSLAWMQQEGVKPDVVTIATALPVCARLKALKQGKEIHGYAVKNGYFPNVSIVTSLMVMYSQCGVLEHCCKLFNGMERRNVKSWTAMIDSYLKNQCWDEALMVFRSMVLSKHRPDSIAISRMLITCGELKASKLGKATHGHVLRRGFESVPFISSEIVRMYGKCREIERAKLVYDVNPWKGPITWTAIIEAYGDNSRYKEALDLFDEVESNGFTPNHHTFIVVLSICDQAGLANEACWIFNSMMKKYSVKATEEHFSIIIGLLMRLGHTEGAERYIRLRSLLS